MKLCKQIKFIHGESLADLETKLNDALANGAELGGIDIQTLTGAIIKTEYVGEIEKTLVDELEEAFGRHNCGECPFLRRSNDGRVKWHECTKHGRKVTDKTRCCEAFYREEGYFDLSEDKGKNERIRHQDGRYRGDDEGIAANSIRPFEWSEQIPPVRVRIAFEDVEHAARHFV